MTITPVTIFRIAIPSTLVGLLIGLGFIETPLKFLAPGVTLPIALGIGRLVLSAAEIASIVLIAALTVVSLVGPRVRRSALITLGGTWFMVLIQVVAVRPLLNARTDAILAGMDVGSSPLHIIYIVIDVLLIVLMIAFIVQTSQKKYTPRDLNPEPTD